MIARLVRRGAEEDSEEGADENQRDPEKGAERNELQGRDRVGHTLRCFAPSVTTETDHSGWRSRLARGAAAGFLIALGTALHIGRQQDTPAWESLWAEDASVFLTDAYRDFWGTLFEQNGGYVHLVPRAIGGIATLFPLTNAAVVFSLAGSVVIALLAAFVYAASGDVLRPRSLRLGLGAAVVILPVAGAELYANALNLHFYLVFGCFWALLWQRETWPSLAGRSTMALAGALSDPVCALLLPLAIVGPIVRRSLRALVVSGSFAAGLIVQLALMRGGASPERNWAFNLWDVPDIFSLRVTGGVLVGDRFLDDAWLSVGRTFSVGAVAIVSAATVALLFVNRRRTRAFALMSVAYATLFLGAHLAGRGTGGMDPELGSFHLEGARYVLLPFLFLLTALLALVDGAQWQRAGWIRAAALVWLVALLAANYVVGPNARSSGPQWREEVQEARRACAGRSAASHARILASPAPPEVWVARIPCSRL